ncbi:MAG: NAD(P)-dependent oxidoreductase [Actinomycetota bacterium]|nr:NAD(P)-dependent oxidoreductase [Actinomycetota bacterium]
MNVLVTGGDGYIGSVLVPALLDAGHQVTVLDTFAGNFGGLAALCANERFTPVRGDVRDEALVEEVVAGQDLVIPLAALVGAPLCARDPWAATSVNVEAIRMLLGKLSPDQRVVFPTSNSGYGVGKEGEFCTEESPLRPISHYGRTKVEAENLVLDRGDTITFRLATVFGMSPRLRLDLLVNDFTYRAMTDRVVVVFEGHFKRNYIHVRDVAKAFLHAIDNYDAMKGLPYNVGLSDANLSKLELCAAIQAQVPGFTYLEAPLGKDPDQRNYIVSNERIESTGFRPDWSLEDGIVELIKGYTMVRNTRFTNV